MDDNGFEKFKKLSELLVAQNRVNTHLVGCLVEIAKLESPEHRGKLLDNLQTLVESLNFQNGATQAYLDEASKGYSDGD